MSNGVFKDILVGSQIEEATINQLKKWLPTYLREIERQLGLPVGDIPPPHHYGNRNSFDAIAGEDFPKVIVISPGLAGPPIAKGDGQYRAVWRLGVGVGVAAKTEEAGNEMVKIYGAAVRAIMLHKQSLGGLAQAINWEDESYDDLPIASQNQLYKGAALYFAIDCEDVVTKWAGPETPDDELYAYGRAEHIYIDIEKLPVRAE